MLGTIECTWLMVFAVTGKKQQDIVDHLHGAPHAAAIEMKKLHSLNGQPVQQITFACEP